MNKLIISLVTGLLLTFVLSMSAQPLVTITPQSNEVDPNQEFNVDVVVNNFTNVASVQFPLVWDANVIEYVAVSNINGAALSGLTVNSFGFNPAVPGKLTFLWFEQNFNGVSLDNGTRLFTITFKAIQDGTSDIAITSDPPGIEVTNPDEQEIGLTAENATVKVGDGQGNGGGGPIELKINNQNVVVGNEVCLKVRVENFTDISDLQFSVSFDHNLLQFKEARKLNANLNGLSANAIANPSDGKLTFQWSDPGGNGNTLSDNATVLELCFDALAVSNTKVRVEDNPVATEATRQLDGGTSENPVINISDGTVNITEPAGPEDFELIMENMTVEPGANFCMPVRVKGFQDIVGLQFTVRYDANLLEFTGASNFNGNVNDLGNANLSNPSDGIIRFQWNDGSFTGADLNSNAVLFQLCFKARGSGTTTVEFSNNPLAIEVTQKLGADDEQLLDFSTQNGVVTIQGNTSGPGFSGFGLYLEDEVVQSGDDFCLPIKVQDFDNILGMQFSIQYDANALELNETKSFGLNGLTSGSIGMPGPGVITLVWDDPAVTGQSLADGATLFELCFTAKANNGTSTVVSFAETPTPAEFIQVVGNDEQEVDYNFRNGRVTFGDDDGSFDGFGLLVGDDQIETGTEFCVPVTVQDFENILGMQLSINYNSAHLEFQSVQNFGLNGLSAGSFGNPSVGNITLVWDDPAVTGQSLSNEAVLFELCFKALAPNGTTTFVSITDSPTPVEFVQKIGNDEQTIDYGTKIGTIIIDLGEDDLAVMPTGTGNTNTIVVDTDCFGASTGSITLAVQGGSGAYTYSWDYESATTKDLTDIPAGVYGVTVTDSSTGQSVSGAFTVEQPSAALSADIQSQDVNCDIQGSIMISVTGGTPEYTINWNGDLQDNVTEQNNLNPGTYSFAITDANGCTFNSEEIRIRRVGNNQLTLMPEYIDPETPGAIQTTVSGGGNPFKFAWRGPDDFRSTNKNLSGLTVVGEYCLTVTNAEGCVTTKCVSIYEVMRFGTVNVTNACTGEENGRIEIALNGGLAPYSYEWSTGSTAEGALEGLASGTYGLTVTDDKGDQLTGSFEVNQFSAIALEPNIVQVSGNESNQNGKIELTISGGRPGYTINWDNGATEASIADLSTGTYCVTVTDKNNCSATSCFNVTFQSVPLSFSTTAEPVSCNGNTDGILKLNIIGGSLPYEITFEDGTTINSDDGQVSQAGFSGGEVKFTIKDAGNVTLEGSEIIPEPDALQILTAAIVHDVDEPGCTGSISLNIAGGTPGYNVLWNSPNTGAQIINLCEGEFIPTIADSKGCTKTFDPIIITSFKAAGQVVNSSCPESPDGGVTLNLDGGARPYAYQWTNEMGEAITTDSSLTGVLPGRYIVTISEASGNQIVREFVIGSVSNLSLSVDVMSDFNGFGVSCLDANDGNMRAQGLNGTGTFMYEWVLNGEMVGTEEVLTDAVAGTYEVTAIDETGCVITTEVDLGAPPPIIIAETISNISCTGSTDGEIEVRATGGAGSNFFSFEWDNGVEGNTLSRLRAGTYIVTTTDGFDCQSTQSFEISEPDPLIVNVATTPANDGCNGTALANVTGGTAPYLYVWNAPQTDSLIIDLCPGTYMVQVTDARGCKPIDDSTTSGLVADRRFACMEAIAVITPNGDGDNELFMINCIEEFPDNRLEVYNRWGQMVFEVQNYDNSWGGTDKNGNVLAEGAYYYVVAFTDGNGNAQQEKGSFSLLLD